MTFADHDEPSASAPVEVVGSEHPRATAADAARTIVASSRHGMLATIATRPAGFPFGSVVAYALDVVGNPLMVISEMAEHTRNAGRDPRASLLVTEPTAAEHDPLDGGRVTLLGELRPVGDDEQDDATGRVVDAVPSVAGYAHFGDFSCWRLTVTAVRWVGGFGAMDWVDADGYVAAVSDPVLAARRAVLDHMNADHADACLAIVGQALARDDLVAVEMVGVDRFGCDYHARAASGRDAVRVRLPFSSPVADVGDVRRQLVDQTRRARRTEAGLGG